MVNTKTDLAKAKVVCADVKQWADEYDGPPFHAVLCDAPYHLGDAGFMSKDWDAGGADGVSCQPETWRGIARHLLPGAFLFVFAGTINDDLISVAMRRAGLRKHHKAVHWANGQGFPKATRIKADGWAGHRYGLQSLKPSIESILIFQKPYESRPVDSITETGAGALWIEGARIKTSDSLNGGQYCGTERQSGSCYGKHRNLGRDDFQQPSGRWPANLLLSHVPPHLCPDCNGDGCDTCGGEGLVGGCRRVGERRIGSGEDVFNDGDSTTPSADGYCRPNASMYTHKRDGKLRSYGAETVADWDCVDGCAVKALGKQSGERRSSQGGGRRRGGDSVFGMGRDNRRSQQYYDEGTCARYFFQAGWSYEIAEQIEQAAPVFYCAKSSRRERDSGLENFDEQPVRRLSGGEFAHNSITRKVSKNETVTRNPHPTCKPITLAKHLATLLLPPPEYAPRRLLIPFCGTMSEGIGAMLAGWEEIVGIDIVPSYCDIAEARLAWWTDWMSRTGSTDPKEILKSAKANPMSSSTQLNFELE